MILCRTKIVAAPIVVSVKQRDNQFNLIHKLDSHVRGKAYGAVQSSILYCYD
jgi:hypothetical protein